jgi:hypothetical protein
LAPATGRGFADLMFTRLEHSTFGTPAATVVE